MAWMTIMAKPRGTDGSLLASLPWTLVALLLALIPHIQFLPIWITAAFVACAAWRYVIEQRRRPLPPTWLRAGLALFCFLGVLATYSSVSGVGPGSALLAIMAALKLLETRKRRDQFVLLFISIFLVMSSLLREQYLWSLPYLMVAILLIMTAWLRMSATRNESSGRSFRTAGRLVLYALPLALAMWVIFPRIATPFWAVPIDNSAGTSGISDTMSPGDISSLSLSDAVAFRVEFAANIPPGRDRYWRGLVLHRFNGRTWSGSEPMIDRQARDNIVVSGDPVEYTITLEPTRQQWVFALDIPFAWNLRRTTMGRQQQLSRVHPIDQRVVYDAVSYPEYRSDVNLRAGSREWYMQLPEGSNPRTAELARSMYDAAGSKPAYVEAVLQKFNQEEYFYTLHPPALGRDPVDEFLFNTRQGFCEHYASTFAVMMRSVGIPSRIVLGYQGGELNSSGEDTYLIVRQSDAHAWTEVWIEGIGWYRVDPTAAVAPERIDAGMTASMFNGTAAAWGLSAPSAFLHNLGLSWDAVNAKWNDWVLGYGPEKQQAFLERLGMADPSWRKMLLALPIIVLGLLIGISLLMSLRYRTPRPDKAARLYRTFVKKTGVTLNMGETPDAFAAKAHASSAIDDELIDSITTTYLAARYGQADAKLLLELETQVRQLR
jgi:transglutaminase-like putative cysteine protease